MWKDFRDFIMRGNVLDLAVAVIIGTAFNAIVTSLVNDIIMPLIGIIIGGINFSALAITIGTAVVGYGKFIQAIVNFVIIAFTIFLILRVYERLRKKEEPPAPTVVEDPKEVVLLTQIRDLLKNNPVATNPPPEPKV